VTDTPLLEIRDLSKTFGSVQALTEVDFEVREGEVMALVGDNGAGKSTLIKCIAGIHGYDSGEIVFDGKPVTIHSPKDAARLGIEVVYQDLALCDNLDVVQNMYLGREERDWLFRLKEPVMEQRTAETLRGLAVGKARLDLRVWRDDERTRWEASVRQGQLEVRQERWQPWRVDA